MDYDTLAWVKRGSARRAVLMAIYESGKPLSTNEIREIGSLSLSQCSRVLKELVQRQLVECLNPNDKIGKIFIISKTGKGILDEI